MKSPSPRLRPRVFVLAALVALALGCGTSATDAPAILGAGGQAPTVAATTGGGGALAIATPLSATSIALGTSHSCALLDSGEVACWGDGSSGQLGDGNAASGYYRATAVKVPGLTGVRAVRAGGDTTCAILATSVVCWGDGTYGQLGNGMAGPGYVQASPTRVTGLTTVVDLAISGTSACAVASDGTVLCWGRNTAGGWLGFMSSDCGPYPGSTGTALEQPCEKAPRTVPGVNDGVAVVTSDDHCCALLQGGTITCWGADNYGQLGDGFSGTTPHDPSPVAVTGIIGASRVAVGASHSCAVVGDDHATACWGDNSYGQLGNGTNALDSNEATPAAVPGLEHVVDLDAAASVTCAVLNDGTARCWGDPTSLFPSNERTASPVPVEGINQARMVRTGGTHACVLNADRTVSCWGLDDNGQLGDGQLSLGNYYPSPVAAP